MAVYDERLQDIINQLRNLDKEKAEKECKDLMKKFRRKIY